MHWHTYSAGGFKPCTPSCCSSFICMPPRCYYVCIPVCIHTYVYMCRRWYTQQRRTKLQLADSKVAACSQYVPAQQTRILISLARILAKFHDIFSNSTTAVLIAVMSVQGSSPSFSPRTAHCCCDVARSRGRSWKWRYQLHPQTAAPG